MHACLIQAVFLIGWGGYYDRFIVIAELTLELEFLISKWGKNIDLLTVYERLEFMKTLR